MYQGFMNMGQSDWEDEEVFGLLICGNYYKPRFDLSLTCSQISVSSSKLLTIVILGHSH